jgi:uncharacterized protein YndB with AHSA1/START domain
MSTRSIPQQSVRIAMPTEREVAVTRLFHAPRHLVFEALTRPALLKRWMFAPGRTLSVCEVDLRAGGNYRFVFRGPGKKDVGVRGVYREISHPERLVNTEEWEDWDAGETLVTNSLTERAGQTTLTITSRFPSTEVRDAVVAAGLKDNAELVYSALADLLAEIKPVAGAFA